MLALAAWNAWRSERHEELAWRLYRVVRDLRVLEVPLLASITKTFRQYARERDGEYGVNARFMDALRDADHRARAERVREVLERIIVWSERRHGDNPPARWYGIDIETVATAVGIVAQWAGFHVDLERLDAGLDQLQPQSPALEALGPLGDSLRHNYEAVAETVSENGVVRPTYALQTGKRLGADYPPIQSFTTKGGEWSSVGLVVPRPGHVLAAMDVRAAEFLTMGCVWRDRYEGDPRAGNYLQAVLDGYQDGCLDIHERIGATVGESLKGRVPAKRLRDFGKLVNSSIVNGASDKGMATTLRVFQQQAGISSSVTEEYIRDMMKALSRTYTVDRWRGEIQEFGSKRMFGAVDLPDGRRMPAKDGRQLASRLTQTYFADAYALACFWLIVAGYRPCVLRFDEVVVELQENEDPADVQTAFLQGFQETFGEVPVDCVVKICPERWGRF